MKRIGAVIGMLVVLTSSSIAQTTTIKQPQPGFNLFSVSQDIEIGKQSAVEAEKQLRLLNQPSVDRYLNRIVSRLALYAPGAKYPYQIKAVNSAEINAFALPGGPMYVNRGLLQTARSEAELAGVLAHELSHVALRHGTHQASKAYLSQSGLGILGGLLGRQSNATKVLNTVGGVGLTTVFLKFSRDDENEADLVGAQMMAKAGYDPLAMASFFELLRAEQGRDPSKLEQFFSDHPSAANREARIRTLAASLGTGRTQVIGGFATMQNGLGRLPPAVSTQVAAIDDPVYRDTVQTLPTGVAVEPPSATFVNYRHPSGFFTIDHPQNWRAYRSGLALSMAPDGGVMTRSDGREVMVYGVIVNHYVPFEGEETRFNRSLQRSYAPFEDRTRRRAALEDATDDLVRTVLASNSYLQVQDAAAQPVIIDGASGFSVMLQGFAPATGEEERVTIYTRALPDGHVVYALWVVPTRLYGLVQPTFAQILRSLNVNDAAAHRVAVNP